MGMKWVVKVETRGLVEPTLGWEAKEDPEKVCLPLSEGLIPEGESLSFPLWRALRGLRE